MFADLKCVTLMAHKHLISKLCKIIAWKNIFSTEMRISFPVFPVQKKCLLIWNVCHCACSETVTRERQTFAKECKQCGKWWDDDLVANDDVETFAKEHYNGDERMILPAFMTWYIQWCRERQILRHLPRNVNNDDDGEYVDYDDALMQS